jgi:hypothetical protein
MKVNVVLNKKEKIELTKKAMSKEAIVELTFDRKGKLIATPYSIDLVSEEGKIVASSEEKELSEQTIKSIIDLHNSGLDTISLRVEQNTKGQPKKQHSKVITRL